MSPATLAAPAGAAYASLQHAGAARIVSGDTIPHPSNEIEISGVVTAELAQLLKDVGSGVPGMQATR